MPAFDTDTTDKILELQTLVLSGEIPEVFELVRIDWPEDTRYYCVTKLDEVLEDPNALLTAIDNEPLEVRLVAPETEHFVPVSIDGSIGDEEIELKFMDFDGEFSDLLGEHGEGVKVTLLHWFPQVELLLPIFEAHLKLEDDADGYFVQITGAQGMRSSDGVLPKRAHYPTCQAVYPPAHNLTQAEIDEYQGCPDNSHLPGGTIGNGLFDFCPRLSTDNCIERDINPLFHLSHRTMTVTVIGTQSSGGPTFSTSAGNETNLKEAVRVVMGTRRVYDMKVLAFQRHPVTSNPDHGFFEANYEISEGPIAAVADAYVTIGGDRRFCEPIHTSIALGNLGQPAVSNPVTTHGYSGTAIIRNNYGWINPANVDQNDASADAIIRGIRNIRQYVDAGAGLVAEYFGASDFTNLILRRIDAQVNYPTATGAPAPAVPPVGFSVRRTGFITFPTSGEWTLTIDHDDSARLVIDGDELINNVNVGIDSNTFTAVADTPYPIIIDHVQGNATGPHPWRMVFNWELSDPPRDVPESAFTHDATSIMASTSNRAWQIAEMLTNKRWGFGYDIERLAMAASFLESATWGGEYVRFTDFDGNEFEHYRSKSDVDLQEKKVQEQIENMCLAGRFSRPFLFDGLIHIVPLRALTEDELGDCPVFTDEGDTGRNIVFEDEDDVERSTLRWSRQSDFDLKNRVELTFDDESNDWLETAAHPVEDVDAQIRAGRVVGDNTRKTNVLKESLLGVTNENHAIKLAWAFMDLGKFDEGGLQNNLRVTFKTWFMFCLDLHPFKVIKVVNAKMNDRFGFQYFRIMTMEREGDLQYKITAQAYNETYMETFEEVIEAPPIIVVGGGDGNGCTLTLGTITEEDGIISVPIEPC